MIISVILTTFRREALLVRAAQSVIKQTVPANVSIELLIIDDDPKGSASSVLPALQENLPEQLQLVYIKAKSGFGGVARARNRGLDTCNGAWVIFLDDDDLLLDDALNTLLLAALQEQVDFCAGAYHRVSEDINGKVIRTKLISPSWSPDTLMIRNLFPIGSYLAKRSLFTARFNAQLRTHEDWLFLLDNLRGARVKVLNKSVLQVRLAVDASRKHRNTAGGSAQRAADYARIYSIHPAPELAARRLAMIERLGGTTLSALFGAPAGAAPLQYRDTSQGRFLICNPTEAVQSALLREGHFEAHLARFAEAVVPLNPGAIVDIGANFGVFSVAIARALPRCKVISVEPRQMVFMQLCANLIGNKISNARPLNLAIGSAMSGESFSVPFVDVFSDNASRPIGGATANPLALGANEAVADASVRETLADTVPLKSLDELTLGLGVAFIRIASERKAREILSSGESLLMTQRPTLLFPAWSLSRFETERRELIQYLQGLGYSTFLLNESGFAHHPQTLDSSQIRAVIASLGFEPGLTAA